jgi:hypothetical protein
VKVCITLPLAKVTTPPEAPTPPTIAAGYELVLGTSYDNKVTCDEAVLTVGYKVSVVTPKVSIKEVLLAGVKPTLDPVNDPVNPNPNTPGSFKLIA